MLEMKILGIRTETTEDSFHRIEMKDRISGAEDMIEDTDTLVKENVNSNNFFTQNMQEIWDTMKRPNLRIIRIEEGEETQLKGQENIFSKIKEYFLNLKRKRYL